MYGSFFAAGVLFTLFSDMLHLRWNFVLIAGLIAVISMFNLQCAKTCLPIFGGYAFLGLAYKPIRLLEWAFRMPDLSYGVYLYGWPVEKLVHWTFPEFSLLRLFATSLLGAVLLAVFSWYVVERRFLARAS